MKKIKAIVKRTIYSLLVLIGLSIIIFTMARMMPGDPVRMALGARAPEWVVQKMKEASHLDKPIYIQYYFWIKNTLRGDLGVSWLTRRPVIEDIKIFFPASLELVLYTAIFMGILGITLGTLAGWYTDTWVDNIVRVIAYIGVVTPSFALAIFLMLLFSYVLKIFPTIGRLSPGITPPPVITNLITIDALIAGRFDVFFDALKHLVLPMVSLAMLRVSSMARLTRSGIVDTLKKDYIAAERSYGISERIIMFKYLLKPSVIPAISIFGLSCAQLFANGFLVETIFNWPGISRYGMDALLNKDLNAIVAVVLIIGTLFIIVNIIIDWVVTWLDPRIQIRVGSE